MQLKKHKNSWWFDPKLPSKHPRVPTHLRDLDPTEDAGYFFVSRKRTTGQFSPERKWVRYHQLNPLDAGYITDLYDLKNIGRRYGLSATGIRYFRNHILPEPYDIVRRRSVSAHHWSRFTLMALDVVLADLESKGELRILSTYKDHIDLVHIGSSWLEDHYAYEAEEKELDNTDRFNVHWYQ